MHLYSVFRAIQYVERNGMAKYYTLDHYPDVLEKKMNLLAFFQSYLKGSVMKVEASHHSKEEKFEPKFGLRLPFLRHWFRTPPALVMHLANGTLQVNHIRRFKMLHLTTYFCHYSTGLLFPRSRQNYSVSGDGCCYNNR